MAFQNLRNGSTVYVFYKTSSPKLEIGQVVNEPKLRQKFPLSTGPQPYTNPNYLPQQHEQVLDLSIKIGDKLQPIEGLTPALDIQDCGNGLFIACNRDAVNAEVVAYMHNSEVAIDEATLEMHRTIVNNCKHIMSQLNPEIDHLEKHISRELGFSPYSESASYLVGEIIKDMSYDITRKYYARINRE